jgi:hypothetical protein
MVRVILGVDIDVQAGKSGEDIPWWMPQAFFPYTPEDLGGFLVDTSGQEDSRLFPLSFNLKLSQDPASGGWCQIRAR